MVLPKILVLTLKTRVPLAVRGGAVAPRLLGSEALSVSRRQDAAAQERIQLGWQVKGAGGSLHTEPRECFETYFAIRFQASKGSRVIL